MVKKSVIEYTPPGETIRQFHLSDKFVRVLIGPFGSGKTKSMLFEIWRRARMQAPHNGRRKTRWLVARVTYPELLNSTVPDWRAMLGPEYGQFTQAPTPKHEIRVRYFGEDGKHDGTIIECDVFFMAFDGAGAAESLRSMEFTGAYLNEMAQFEKPVLDMITSRIRYAPLGSKPTWVGIWGHTNAPDQDHWLYKICEEERPPNWAVFKQPPAVFKNDKGLWKINALAENIANLQPDGVKYYRNILSGKSEDWIKVNLCNEYGYVVDGKPVYPGYADTVHCAKTMLEPIPGLPLFVGLDFGLTPAAVFAQRTMRGQWRILDELVTEDMGAVRFGGLLAGRLAEWYSGYQIRLSGDPAGGARASTDETTCFEIIKDQTGLEVHAAPTQDIVLRIESVALALNRLWDGLPGLVLSPAAKTVRKGFAGGYRYRRLKVAGEERYHDVPEKNRFSHPHDAIQAMFLDAGEGASVIGRAERDLAQSRADATADSAYAVLDA